MKEQPQQQNGWTPIEDAKRAFSFLAFAAQVLAHPVEVFLRRGFGSQYFGLASVVAFFTIPLWSLFFPTENPIGMWSLWALWLVFQLRARIVTGRMVARGEVVHSRYDGTPIIAKLFKSVPEGRLKGTIEPFIVFLTALALMEASVPLASFLIASAFALAFNYALIESLAKARTRELNDALIEQQVIAERFRNMRGDR